MKKPLNIGHRGAMGHETENTISSIKKALELDVDMIEIDVFVIKSGEVVVFHDDLLDSLTNAKGKIEDYTWEDLKKVVVKGDHKIPLLEDVITTINKKTPLNIELKGSKTAKPVFDILTAFYGKGWTRADFNISSFLWEELENYRKLDTTISIGILTEENPIDAITIAQKLKAQSINPWYKTLTSENIELIHKKGFKIYTYTVNEPDTIKQMIRLGVDGIFCNYPERLH
ncbi:glycerophosphodiester phosphodiesterase [Flavobacterium sp.]|jgi:glycerophosphoryl diester phosphodiesterase|uniref:glycerophosphodiester phosphodiesterase n=1 Tax=Flavobacterium sp. TaxID=239 RepID=UPI0037BFAEDD